jgi:hypothetical protein
MATHQYEGGCQCGSVRFVCEADLTETLTCNCSRCQKLGSVLAFTTADRFTLQKGEEVLQEYLFNKMTINHLFCRVCGIQSFSYPSNPDGSKTVAINVNCLDRVEPRELKSFHLNGRDF